MSQLLLPVQEAGINRELFKELIRKYQKRVSLNQTAVAIGIGMSLSRFSERLNEHDDTAFFNVKELASIISYLDEKFAFHTLPEKVELFLAGLPPVASSSARIALVKTWLDEDITIEDIPDFEGNIETAAATHLHNKPATRLPMLPITSFLGRANELSFCREFLLNKKARLLTITGMGGIGKTRLALELAHDLVKAGCYKDGVSFIKLETARNGKEFICQLYATFGLTIPENVSNQEQIECEAEQLADYLAGKHMLLILDNLEQLLDDAAANTIISLLSHAPGLQIMTTSREITRIPGEHVLRLQPLGLPPKELDLKTVSESVLLKYPAVALFIDRAVAASSGAAVTAAPSVVTLCQKLSGIPLALELAAAQTRYTSPDELLAKLNKTDFTSSLTTNLRFVPERHISIEAVIEWSINLLSQSEKELLIVLAGLGEYFTLAQIANLQNLSSNRTYLLYTLVDKSLIQIEIRNSADEIKKEIAVGCFFLLDLIRSYLLEIRANNNAILPNTA